MTCLYRVVLFTLLCLAVSYSAVICGDFEWKPVTNADWKVMPDSAKKISDAAVIFEYIVDDNEDIQNGDIYLTIYRRIRILSDEGREWGDVEVPILGKDQKIKEIKGRTILRGSRIVELEKDNIFKKEIVKTKGTKVKQTTFSMPGVTDDCIIEYMIKIDGGTSVWIAQKNIPVLNFEYRWLLPEIDVVTREMQEYVEENFNPNYLFLNQSGEINLEQLPNLKNTEELRFTTTNIPPYESEPHSMPEAALKTKLITYFGSRENPMSYWGDWSESIIDYQEKFSKKNKKLLKIVETFAALETDDEKITAAYNWVMENIHNVTYYDLYDPKDKSKKLKLKDRDNINDVIKRGYGGRTDINRVFCDMLREMNIDAKMAYAKDRFEDLFVLEAKYWQFDRSMVAVKTSYKSYDFYSPGHAITPQNMIPWFIEGVNVLVGDNDNNLTTVPFSTDDQNTYSYVFNYNIDDELEVDGEFSARLKGQPARSMRIKICDEDSTEHNHMLKEMIEGKFDDKEIELVSFKNMDTSEGAAVYNCTIEQPELEDTGGRILFKPFMFTTNTKNPFYANKRKSPILFNYAYQCRESAQFNIPEGWTVEALPADTTYKNMAGSCTVTFEQLGDGISVQKVFIVSVPFWSVQTYSLIKNLYQSRQEFSELIVVLKESE